MSRPNKHKVSTDAPAPGGGLFNAFSALTLDGLPPGPPAPEVALEPSAPASSGRRPGRVVLRRETAHRNGKCVVVLDGFDESLDDAFLNALARRLRAACGCGGALKGRTIEIQGDQAQRVRELLGAEGFRVAGV